MKNEKIRDIILFVVLLITGFLILIFYNKIVGALITISSLIPVHQEVIKFFRAMYTERKNSNPIKKTQKAKGSRSTFVQINGDNNAPIHAINTNRELRKKR